MARERKAKRREGNEIEFSRIVAFSDGVFAIAITLLVLTLDIPEHLHGESVADALWDQRENLLAYALSFAVIGRFWIVHHRFFSTVTGFDGRLIGLNIFYLAWIVLLPFSSKVLGDHGGETAAVVLYAVNLSGVVLTGLWMEADARTAPALPRSRPPSTGNSGSRRSTSPPSSWPRSRSPSSPPTSPPLIWLALFFDPAARFAAAERPRLR